MASKLQQIQGPYACIFYNAYSNRIWFTRDPLGRRSLLLRVVDEHGAALVQHDEVDAAADDDTTTGAAGTDRASSNRWPLDLRRGSTVVVASVSDTNSRQAAPLDAARATLWHEVDVHYLHCLTLATTDAWGCCSMGSIARLPWPHGTFHSGLDGATQVPFACREAPLIEDCESGSCEPRPTFESAARQLYSALREAVRRRVVNLPAPHDERQLQQAIGRHTSDINEPNVIEYRATGSRLGVLFSGGLDSLVLTAIASSLLPIEEPIEYVFIALNER